MTVTWFGNRVLAYRSRVGPQLYVATRVLTRGGVVETHRGKATRRRGRGPEQRDASDSQPRTQALGEAGEGSPKGPGGVRPASPGAQTSPSGRLASRHLRLRQLQAASAVAWRGFVFQGKQDPDGGLVFAPHRELRETFI